MNLIHQQFLCAFYCCISHLTICANNSGWQYLQVIRLRAIYKSFSPITRTNEFGHFKRSAISNSFRLFHEYTSVIVFHLCIVLTKCKIQIDDLFFGGCVFRKRKLREGRRVYLRSEWKVISSWNGRSSWLSKLVCSFRDTLVLLLLMPRF